MQMKQSFWSKQRVLITGGNGFLGKFVVDKLHEMGTETVFSPKSAQYDLRHHAQVLSVLQDTEPTMVIHLAAVVGGI